jgi:hypothetical protein
MFAYIANVLQAMALLSGVELMESEASGWTETML